MGVTGLWKLIDSSGKPVPLEMLENKVLAVDISIWLHQVVKGFQDQKGSSVPNAHLLGLFNRLCKLLYYRIKPVFVFDGGVPTLKKETIVKRYQNKNKIQSESERIQQLLLNSLAKEKIIQKALGVKPNAVVSPTKKNNIKEIEQDDLFKLPESANSSQEIMDSSATAESDYDSSLDEESEVNYYRNLKAIDVNSSHFMSLPADIRYDLLSEIKETRKHSSWRTINELPAESNEFCSFQMKRLLKRRKVQVSLEETEKEIGGKCLTMDVLENLLLEDGIDVDKSVAVGGQIASDENTRYVLVRDLKNVIESSKTKKVLEQEIKKEEKVVNPEDECTREYVDTTAHQPGGEDSVEYIHEIEDDDIDLQKAIQMSLLTEDPNLVVPLNVDDDNVRFDEIKMSTQQKRVLGKAAHSLARGYLLENAGMTNEEFKDLIDVDEANEEPAIDSTFKYNDSFVAYGKSTQKSEPETSTQAELNREHSECKSISSDTDPDMIDVPDDDFNTSEMNIFPSIFMQGNTIDMKDMSKDFRIDDLAMFKKLAETKTDEKSTIQVVVKPDEINHDDDIFADVFSPKTAATDKVPEIQVKTNIINSANDILKELEKQKSDVLKLDLNDIQLDKHLIEPDQGIDIDAIFKKTKAKSNIAKPDDDDGEDSDATIVDESLHLPSIDEKMAENTKVEIKVLPTIVEKNEKNVAELIKISSPDSKSVNEVKEISTPEADPKAMITSQVQRKINESSPPSKIENVVELVDPEKLIEEAAEQLRVDKSKDELNDMMAEISKEKHDLDVAKNKQDRFSASITEQMSRDCMNLLKLFGIPYIVAPMEAEAQCAFLNYAKLTDGTITDDSDIWLFGGQTVYKNFFNQNKNVMEFRIENIEKLYKIDRNKMIQIAFLTGSDYTSGITGIGAVTALEILASFPSTPEIENETNRTMSILSGLRKFKNWFINSKAVTTTPQKHSLKSKLKNIEIIDSFPHTSVVEAYLYPTVDENLENFIWGYPNARDINEFTRKTFGWTNVKTDEILNPVLKKLDDRKLQQTITNYFNLTASPTVKNLKVSKRVKKAINQMGGQLEDDDLVAPAQKRVTKRKPKEVTITDCKDEDGSKHEANVVYEGGPSHENGNEKLRTLRKRKGPAPKTGDEKVAKRQVAKRKLKVTGDPVAPPAAAIDGVADPETGEIEPSTSSNVLISPRTNRPTRKRDDANLTKILNKKEVIPQRVKDEQEREDQRLKATEIFKKSKKT